MKIKSKYLKNSGVSVYALSKGLSNLAKEGKLKVWSETTRVYEITDRKFFTKP